MFKIKLILLSLFILIVHNSYATEKEYLNFRDKELQILQFKISKTEKALLNNFTFKILSALVWGFTTYKLLNAYRDRDDWFQFVMAAYVGGYYALTALLYTSIELDKDYHEKKLAFLKEQLKAAELASAQICQDALISDQSACHS
jgi:cellobiose-specific phosphotransferase system component IIC